jgi:hypothetical protein
MEFLLKSLHGKFGTQDRIASAFDVSQEAVAQWFSRKRLPMKRAKKTAALLGMSVEQVMAFYD